MKFGLRQPSFKKSLKARTTGKAKRKIKKSLIPGYGKKGTGVFKDPKKAVYNKIYNKTSFRVFPSMVDAKSPSKKRATDHKKSKDSAAVYYDFDADNHLIDDGDFSIYDLDAEKLNELTENRRQHKLQQKAHKKSLPIWEKIFYSEKPKLTNKEKEVYTQAMLYYGKQVGSIGDKLSNLKDPGKIFTAYYESLSVLYKFIKVYENSGNIINYDGPNPLGVLENLVLEKDNAFNEVIRGYYEKEKGSAMELKTTRGQNNRMKRKYEDLMAYDYVLSSENKALLHQLWSDYI